MVDRPIPTPSELEVIGKARVAGTGTTAFVTDPKTGKKILVPTIGEARASVERRLARTRAEREAKAIEAAKVIKPIPEEIVVRRRLEREPTAREARIAAPSIRRDIERLRRIESERLAKPITVDIERAGEEAKKATIPAAERVEPEESKVPEEFRFDPFRGVRGKEIRAGKPPTGTEKIFTESILTLEEIKKAARTPSGFIREGIPLIVGGVAAAAPKFVKGVIEEPIEFVATTGAILGATAVSPVLGGITAAALIVPGLISEFKEAPLLAIGDVALLGIGAKVGRKVPSILEKISTAKARAELAKPSRVGFEAFEPPTAKRFDVEIGKGFDDVIFGETVTAGKKVLEVKIEEVKPPRAKPGEVFIEKRPTGAFTGEVQTQIKPKFIEELPSPIRPRAIEGTPLPPEQTTLFAVKKRVPIIETQITEFGGKIIRDTGKTKIEFVDIEGFAEIKPTELGKKVFVGTALPAFGTLRGRFLDFPPPFRKIVTEPARIPRIPKTTQLDLAPEIARGQFITKAPTEKGRFVTVEAVELVAAKERFITGGKIEQPSKVPSEIDFDFSKVFVGEPGGLAVTAAFEVFKPEARAIKREFIGFIESPAAIGIAAGEISAIPSPRFFIPSVKPSVGFLGVSVAGVAERTKTVAELGIDLRVKDVSIIDEDVGLRFAEADITKIKALTDVDVIVKAKQRTFLDVGFIPKIKEEEILIPELKIREIIEEDFRFDFPRPPERPPPFRPRPPPPPPRRPIIDIPDDDEPLFPLFKKKKKITKKGFIAFIKRKGEFFPISKAVTKAAALDIGATAALTTLAARFKIIKAGVPAARGFETGAFRRARGAFRAFAIRKGKRIALRDEFIQLRAKRLATPGERREIQLAKAKTINLLGRKMAKKKKKMQSFL